MSRWLRRCDRGSVAVEVSIVGLLLCTVTLAIVETSLLWWLKSGIQATAELTARCGALGYKYSTTTCVSSTSTQSYAVTTAQAWLFQNVIAASDVTVTGSAPSCNGVSGTYFTVSISAAYFSFLPAPIGGITVSANACYPMA
jgi:Flp pilus assembly protein TadG